MPDGLLRGGEPDDRQSGPHWLVLPLSITAHVGVAAVMIIIPLAAAVELPEPHRQTASYLRASVVPPVEVPAPRGNQTGPAQPAIVTAPPFISESDEAPLPDGGTAPSGKPVPGIPSGVAGGIGPIGLVATGPPPLPPSPPPAAERIPVPVGGLISAPRKTVHGPPVYPEIARAAGVEGTVILEAVINERGEIERLKVLRSVVLLDGAALRAVAGWRYSPTTLNNVPVPVLMTITVTFSLRD